MAGAYSAEKIYSMSRGILEETMDRTIEKLTGKYILIDQILIIGVTIPETLKRAIEAKLTQQQNVIQYDYVLSVARKEAERKRIEAEGIRDFQKIVTPGISPNFLRWKGIEATLDLSKSANAKVIVIGAQSGLPLILDTSSALPSTTPQVPLLPKPSASPFEEPPVEKINPSSSTNPGLLVPVPVATPAPEPSGHRNLWFRPFHRPRKRQHPHRRPSIGEAEFGKYAPKPKGGGGLGPGFQFVPEGQADSFCPGGTVDSSQARSAWVTMQRGSRPGDLFSASHTARPGRPVGARKLSPR